MKRKFMPGRFPILTVPSRFFTAFARPPTRPRPLWLARKRTLLQARMGNAQAIAQEHVSGFERDGLGVFLLGLREAPHLEIGVAHDRIGLGATARGHGALAFFEGARPVTGIESISSQA